MNTNGNYYVNRLRRRESFKRLINIGLSAICLFLEIALFAYMWQFHFQFQLVDPLPVSYTHLTLPTILRV